MRRTLDYPPVWLAGFAALAWAQVRLAPVLVPGDWALWAGRTLILLGVLVMAAAVRELARHRTTVVPHRLPAALVTSGVYRLSRNPIYLADLAILAGLTLVLGATPSLLLVPVLGQVLTARFIRPEEARLRAAFGPAFEAYAARTRRWI